MRTLQSKARADRAPQSKRNPPSSRRNRTVSLRDELHVRVTGRALVIIAMAFATVITALARSVLVG